jgi:hypothetical protein
MTHTTGQPNVNTRRDGSPSPNESTGPSPIFGAVGMPQFDDPRGASTVQSNGRGNSRPGLSAATMAGLDHFAQQQQQQHQQQMHQPPPYSQYLDGTDEIGRPRSGSEGSKGGNFDRTKERQLVGSLTNSLKFKDGGLVKKVRLFHDHSTVHHCSMFDCLTIDDVCQRQRICTTYGLVLLCRGRSCRSLTDSINNPGTHGFGNQSRVSSQAEL